MSVILPIPKSAYSTKNPYSPALRFSVNVSLVPIYECVTVDTMAFGLRVLYREMEVGFVVVEKEVLLSVIVCVPDAKGTLVFNSN